MNIKKSYECTYICTYTYSGILYCKTQLNIINQRSNTAWVESSLQMLYDFVNKYNNKSKSKFIVTMYFGKKNRNMKSNWNKNPQKSNKALRQGRNRNLGLSGEGDFSIHETASRHFSYFSCFREILFKWLHCQFCFLIATTYQKL